MHFNSSPSDVQLTLNALYKKCLSYGGVRERADSMTESKHPQWPELCTFSILAGLHTAFLYDGLEHFKSDLVLEKSKN